MVIAARSPVGLQPQTDNLLNDKLDCDACGSPMQLDEVLMVNKKGKKRKWKVRRFSCACGFKITVYGKGSRDMCEE